MWREAYKYQPVQIFFTEYTYVKHIPDFDFLQLSQKKLFQNTLNYQGLIFKIFAIYFSLKLIFFTVHIFSSRTFSL